MQNENTVSFVLLVPPFPLVSHIGAYPRPLRRPFLVNQLKGLRTTLVSHLARNWHHNGDDIVNQQLNMRIYVCFEL